ncbi:MotA/TolQ/ExbB proton channel family protein [Qipengyuania nanhaisediminis]|uniref:MotA/TolQ/ExbB proton channel family protein n=1 Tax=Qipengyuania nanhaisediminis TaxID=604088 RepID=UPI0038B29214
MITLAALPASISAADLFDSGALVVVLAGTLLATVARCGRGELRAAAKALPALVRARIDRDANQAALARNAGAIAARGHLCAESPPPPDPTLARLVDIYLVSGSLEAVRVQARADRAGREIARAQAVRVFEFAGELAPVFGLVGTLFAITQLVPVAGASTAEVTMAAVATAVLSSLYGVLTAHLVCVPLARAVERRGEDEEETRCVLIDRFEAMLETGPARPAPGRRDAA